MRIWLLDSGSLTIDHGQLLWNVRPGTRYEHPVYSLLIEHPDGLVLVVGGGYNDEIATYPAEIFDPAAESWSVVTAQRMFRLYHSTAVLLPDGTVLSTGSNNNNTAEIYRPGYLFRGPRPVIGSAPASVRERFRHRYEVDPAFIARLEQAGMIFSGKHPTQPIMQVLELPTTGPQAHPFFLGTQFHPELTSRPLRPQPVFMGLIAAAIARRHGAGVLDDPDVARWTTGLSKAHAV